MIMAGKEQRNPPPIERIHRAYRECVTEFAEQWGCEVDWLANWFEQFAFLRIKEQGMHKNLAAFLAWQDCLGFFDKAGGEPN